MDGKQKVLFISNLDHNQKSLKEFTESKGNNLTEIFGSTVFPLGILSIQSYVRKYCNHVTSKVIDLNASFVKQLRSKGMEQELRFCAEHFEEFLLQEVKETLLEFRPDVVAISLLFDKSISTAILLAKMIRMLCPDCLIIMGGHPANNLFAYILEQTKGVVDAISYGEGEIPFKELLSSGNMKDYLERSPYFVTHGNIKTGFQPQNVYVEHLDDIPMYDYESYFETYGSKVLEYHNNTLDAGQSFNRQAVIMTSRGCPYHCIFCASQEVHGRKMRANSVCRVKQEIDYWVDQKKVETIAFLDDHILYDVDRAMEICDYAGRKGVDIRFPNGLAIAPITEELVQCLERNHVKEVSLALESGSQRVLHEIIRKPVTLDIADRVFGYFKKTNIFVKCFLVAGLPGETEEDIEDGLAYLRQADFNWCTISAATPISGSRLLKECLEKGMIQEHDYDEMSFFKSSYINQDKYNGDLRYTMNLDINFVHNALMRMNRYNEAVERFQSILSNYPNHAFAWYYLAECQKILGMEMEYQQSINHYHQIVRTDAMWRTYAKYFGLVE